jgi:hypothetical protein
MHWNRWGPAFGFLLALESFGQAANAQATARASLDLPTIARQGERWLVSVAGERLPDGQTAIVSTPREHEKEGRPRPEQLYPTPRVSLIARNWTGALTIAGGGTVMDAVRPLRSTRMMLGRVGLPVGNIAPFAQAGLGLWRADPDALAVLVNDTEYALTFGTGFELTIGRRSAVGLECDYTAFYREGRQPQYLPFGQVVAAFAAMKAEF